MNEPQFGVYKAINAVQKALAVEGISKDSKNQQQGYSFRGIDSIYNALAPLLSQHGLCILPRFKNRTVAEHQSKSGATLFYVTVEGEFDFVSAADGSKHTIVTFGEAMDSADKATNKSMSAAYKYACLQAFSIPTEGDNDADAHTPEVAPKPVQPAKFVFEKFQPAMRKKITGLFGANLVHEYAVKAGILTAEQKLEDWPVEHVTRDAAEMTELEKKISAFMAGSPAEPLNRVAGKTKN